MKDAKKKIPNGNRDLADNKDDKKYLQSEEGTLDLPDAEEIPGQEHIHVPRMNEFVDTTISSDDEEGKGILDDEDELSPGSNVSIEERRALRDAAEKTFDEEDDKNLQDAQLDDRDDDGELLNEKADRSGRDLDIPGSEDDDAKKDIGEEDEENNSYSLGNEDEEDEPSKE